MGRVLLEDKKKKKDWWFDINVKYSNTLTQLRPGCVVNDIRWFDDTQQTAKWKYDNLTIGTETEKTFNSVINSTISENHPIKSFYNGINAMCWLKLFDNYFIIGKPYIKNESNNTFIQFIPLADISIERYKNNCKNFATYNGPTWLCIYCDLLNKDINKQCTGCDKPKGYKKPKRIYELFRGYVCSVKRYGQFLQPPKIYAENLMLFNGKYHTSIKYLGKEPKDAILGYVTLQYKRYYGYLLKDTINMTMEKAKHITKRMNKKKIKNYQYHQLNFSDDEEKYEEKEDKVKYGTFLEDYDDNYGSSYSKKSVFLQCKELSLIPNHIDDYQADMDDGYNSIDEDITPINIIWNFIDLNTKQGYVTIDDEYHGTQYNTAGIQYNSTPGTYNNNNNNNNVNNIQKLQSMQYDEETQEFGAFDNSQYPEIEPKYQQQQPPQYAQSEYQQQQPRQYQQQPRPQYAQSEYQQQPYQQQGRPQYQQQQQPQYQQSQAPPQYQQQQKPQYTQSEAPPQYEQQPDHKCTIRSTTISTTTKTTIYTIRSTTTISTTTTKTTICTIRSTTTISTTTKTTIYTITSTISTTTTTISTTTTKTTISTITSTTTISTTAKTTISTIRSTISTTTISTTTTTISKRICRNSTNTNIFIIRSRRSIKFIIFFILFISYNTKCSIIR